DGHYSIERSNKKLSDAFEKCSNDMVSITKSAKENIGEKLSGYPDLNSINAAYDESCARALDQLVDRRSNINNKGYFKIAIFETKCDAKEVTVKTPISEAPISTPDSLNHVGTTTISHTDTSPGIDMAGIKPEYPNVDVVSGVIDDQSTEKTSKTPMRTEVSTVSDINSDEKNDETIGLFADEPARMEKTSLETAPSTPVVNENSETEGPFHHLDTEFNRLVMEGKKEVTDAMSKVRRAFETSSEYLGSHSGKPPAYELSGFVSQASYDDFSNGFDDVREKIERLGDKEKQKIDSDTVNLSPEDKEQKKTEIDNLTKKASRYFDSELNSIYGTDDKEIYDNIYKEYQRRINIPGVAEAQQDIEHSAATSAASRPRNFVSDVVIGTAAILSRALSPQNLVNTYNWITGTGTEQENSSLSHQKQPDVTAETHRSIEDPIQDTAPSGQALKAPHTHPGLVNMIGASQLEKIPMIGGQNISVNNMDSSILQLASLVAAKVSGQNLGTNLTIPISPPDTISAIHNNPASNLLATSFTLMGGVLISKMFKDLISTGQKQSLDASWTPKNILDIAILQEHCSRQDLPSALPQSFLDDVFNSPVVGINSDSDNFDMNQYGELIIKEGKPKKEYFSLFLHGLAKDCRKSSTASASPENPQNDVSDKALAEQIHEALPHTSPGDRAIIFRAITLKDQQQTSWRQSITGSSWPTDRKDQIEKMSDFLNPTPKSQRRKSVPEVKSKGQKLTTEARHMMKEVKEGTLQQGKEEFFKLPKSEIQKCIDKLRNKQDICRLDTSEKHYNDVKKGLPGLLTGESREKRILDETKEFMKNTGIKPNSSDKHKPEKMVGLMHTIKEDQLKQQAWELLIYYYDIKIAVKPELKRAVKLHQRIINEKLSDTPGEAQVLSQLIPEMLGPRKSTRFEMSQSQNGLNNLPVPYQCLKYSGEEVDAKLQQYGGIKKIADSHYSGIFGKNEASKEAIIHSVSQKCLVALHLHEKELSQQKQTDFICYLLQQERGVDATQAAAG
nr:hypothetical protein [Endozoicomonas sp.]